MEHKLIDLAAPGIGRFVAQNRVEMKVAPLGLETGRSVELSLRIVSRIVRDIKMMKPIGRYDMSYRPDGIESRAESVVEVHRRMDE